jgi:hypothetical protein
MFRSLFQDHLQGSSFALTAPTTLQLHALSFVCIGMWSYVLYLYVYPVYLPVCRLVVPRQPSLSKYEIYISRLQSWSDILVLGNRSV